MATPHGEPPRPSREEGAQVVDGGETDSVWVEMERFNPTIQVDEDVENNKRDGKDGDEQLQSGDERHASSAWGRLFRTAENERAPSRTRRKASVAADTSSFELQRQESVESTDSLAPGEPGLRKRKSTASSISSIITGKGKKSKGKTGPKWHTSQNPLFKSAKGEGEQEVVPFYVWGYETVLNFLWPPFNYFRIHFLWIWFLSIFGGILVYVSQLGLSSEMTFLDSLFHAVSACTQTGLFPTNFSQFSRLGQVIIGALIFLGNGVLLTTAPVIIRIYYYRKYFKKNQIANPRTDEYSALWQLVVIIPLYYCVLVGSGWIIMSAHMAGDPAARDIIDRNDNNAAWWGLFHAISGFGNCGYSTFGDNMVQWQRYPLPLIVMSLLIFTGNTAFPLLLRGIIVALYHMPFLKRWKHVYRYMLDNPRRCFTHLFPSSETKWLLLVLLSLNSIEFLFEIMLDWDSSAYDNLNSGQKLVNMYFQSVAIRTSGFNSVDITKLSVANLWLFTGMMYIAASPVAITLRYTSRANDSLVTTGRTAKTTNTVGSQAQTIFMRHFIFLFIGVLFICMIEEVPLMNDPNWSIFKIIFEVVSGYGTVGLTLGYGSLPYSFCGVWKDGSKMVLLFIMILGKHRNLPESVDSAVSVPSYMSNDDDDDSLSDIEVLSDDDDDEVVSLEELDNPGSSEDDKKHKRIRGAGVKHTSTTTDTEGDETQEIGRAHV